MWRVRLQKSSRSDLETFSRRKVVSSCGSRAVDVTGEAQKPRRVSALAWENGPTFQLRESRTHTARGIGFWREPIDTYSVSLQTVKLISGHDAAYNILQVNISYSFLEQVEIRRICYKTVILLLSHWNHSFKLL